MNLASAPVQLIEAFAVNAAPSGGFGGKRTVPVPSQTGITPGAASFNDGFPPLTMTPIPGGIVMSGLDMNGALNQISAIDWWMSAGGSFQYNSGFSSAIGGYPKGARLLNAAGTGYWMSVVDNNVTDPDTGGAGWIPDRAYATVYASAQQSLATGTNKVVWDTTAADSHSMWDATNHRFTALWAGGYRLTGAVLLVAPGGQNLSLQVYKNGSLWKQCIQFPQVSDGNLSYPFDAIVTLGIGDYIELFMVVPGSPVLIGPSSGSGQPWVFGECEYLGN